MPIFKSHKAIFFAKLALVVPLSLITGFTAAMATGGGHGNYFPLMVILGPLNILFIIPLDGPNGGMYFFCGMIFLYVIYAILMKFIKSNKTFVSFSILHIISAFMAIVSNIIGPLFVPGGDLISVLGMNIVVFTLWGLIVWLLFSIYKSRGLW